MQYSQHLNPAFHSIPLHTMFRCIVSFRSIPIWVCTNCPNNTRLEPINKMVSTCTVDVEKDFYTPPHVSGGV